MAVITYRDYLERNPNIITDPADPGYNDKVAECEISGQKLDEIPEKNRAFTTCCRSSKGEIIYRLYDRTVLRQLSQAKCPYCRRSFYAGTLKEKLWEVLFGDSMSENMKLIALCAGSIAAFETMRVKSSENGWKLLISDAASVTPIAVQIVLGALVINITRQGLEALSGNHTFRVIARGAVAVVTISTLIVGGMGIITVGWVPIYMLTKAVLTVMRG